MKNKVIILRISVILITLLISIYCIHYMNQSFDPLARYPYVTNENREVLLKYLDNDDIDYIITQQMKPNVFLEFIDVPGFDIHNAYFYQSALSTQVESKEYIVNFVNRFRQNFSIGMLEELLTYYSYLDLTTFYENEYSLHPDLELMNNLENPYILLNPNKTIYKYIPTGLELFQGVKIKKEMINDLQEMQAAYYSMVGQELVVESGYIAYDQILSLYGEQSLQNATFLSSWLNPAGQNEEQLGYTIHVQGAKDWLVQCQQQDQKEVDYDLIIENLDAAVKTQMEWLAENASRYGFVIRYPIDKIEKTKHWYQPFVLRYVGKATAKTMNEANLCMEEMKFPKELE